MSAGAPARVLIVAGEASGDLYGSLVMQAMRRGEPGRPPRGEIVRFHGVGGPSMCAAGLEPVADASTLGVTGILEVLTHLRAIRGAWRGARDLLRSASRPDLAILIDYPDFNLRLAAHIRKARIPVLYFVSPQVWAWRRGRVPRIAAVVDRMLVILPFEEEIYRGTGMAVEFVGHPLLDLVRPERTRDQALRAAGMDPGRRTVAILPGSRRNELRAHAGILLEAARILKREFRDLQFVILLAPTLTEDDLRGDLRPSRRGGGSAPSGEGDGDFVVVRDARYDALAACDAAIVASGTATMEAALLGIPMVIVYRMNPLTYAIARRISDVLHVGMPNLIAGRRIVPELVQNEVTPARVAREVRRLLTDPADAAAAREALAGVRSRLGRPGAIDRVAAVAWDMIRARRREDAA